VSRGACDVKKRTISLGLNPFSEAANRQTDIHVPRKYQCDTLTRGRRRPNFAWQPLHSTTAFRAVVALNVDETVAGARGGWGVAGEAVVRGFKGTCCTGPVESGCVTVGEMTEETALPRRAESAIWAGVVVSDKGVAGAGLTGVGMEEKKSSSASGSSRAANARLKKCMWCSRPHTKGAETKTTEAAAGGRIHAAASSMLSMPYTLAVRGGREQERESVCACVSERVCV
jgi:hypothetical protein